MQKYFPKVYRSFEDFEREELRRGGTLHQSVDDMLDGMFGEELDFDFDGGRKRRAGDEDEE